MHSLRAQIGLSILALLVVLAATMGYTLYALDLRKHDYLILNLTGQLRVTSLTMQEQAGHYLMGAPDDYDKYNRDLVTYWQGLQHQVEGYDRVMTALKERRFDKSLTGNEETIRCTFNGACRSQVSASYAGWVLFKSGLQRALGDNRDEPRLTAGAAYISKHGPALAESSSKLATAFQKMMEEKLDEIRLFLAAAVVAGLVAAAGLLWLMQRKVIRPVEKTLHGFAKVSRGDFSHIVDVEGRNEISRMAQAFNQLTARLQAIFRLTDRINQGNKLDETLKFAHDEFRGFVPLDWVGVLYPAPDGARMALERCYCARPSLLRQGDSFDSASGVLALVKSGSSPHAAILAQTPQHPFESAMAKDGIRAVVCLPMISEAGIPPVLVFGSMQEAYSPEHVEFLGNIGATVARVLERTVVMENLVAAAVQGLAKLAESRDPETGDHLVRMALYSAIVAEQMGQSGRYAGEITPAYVREVFHFAPMHDIGKVGVPDYVLLKPARLDAAERKEMERHPVIGGEVLRRCEAQVQALGRSMFRVGIEIAECHHEKFDGTGYPKGLQGEGIPLSARIVAAADVFDALTSKRPYKEAWPVEKALEAMRSDAGGHFDPDVIIAMENAMPRMMEIYNRHKHV